MRYLMLLITITWMLTLAITTGCAKYRSKGKLREENFIEYTYEDFQPVEDPSDTCVADTCKNVYHIKFVHVSL